MRPVKAAGAEPWDHRPWGEKPGKARCTPKEQSVQSEARRARDPAQKEPDATHRRSISDALPPPLSNYEDTIRTDRMTPARAPNRVQIVDRRAPERAGDGLSQVTETDANLAFSLWEGEVRPRIGSNSVTGTLPGEREAKPKLSINWRCRDAQ